MDRLKQISNFFGMFTIQKANLLHHVIQQEFTYHSFFYVLSYKMNDIHYIVKWFRATICVYKYKCRYIYIYIYIYIKKKRLIEFIFITVKYKLFYNQRFFSTQSQCCLTLSWIELQMFLRCCLIHVTIIILIFSISLSMSRPRSTYVAYMWCFSFSA